MKNIQTFGIILLVISILGFTMVPGFQTFVLTEDSVTVDNQHHRNAILQSARDGKMIDKKYSSNISFIRELNQVLHHSQEMLDKSYGAGEAPDGINEWDYKLGSWKLKDYTMVMVKNSESGWVQQHPLVISLFIFGMGILGAMMYIFPIFLQNPGIKNNGMYHHPMTRGISLHWRTILLSLFIPGILIFGVIYTQGDYVWPLVTLFMAVLISYFVFYREGSKELSPQRSASVSQSGYLGIITGAYFILFYIVLYWAPEYITGWMTMLDPLSRIINGGDASQWFLYGLLYTVVVLIMGIRMIAKYLHNRYQMVRTGSVIFFQISFAFLIPEILVRLNQPWYDFKNIWPLNYTFFFDWNINTLLSSGGLGLFMLVWGILLIIIAVPLITYFYGKRWYCSWVCGCGGLAETLGDPYRQLSDKSMRAWKYERYIVHGVLVFAIIMTVLVLYTYFTGQRSLGFLNSDSMRGWYGFLIGSAFAGVAGTGFYPLMGNRVWCRYGCPLAAYIGLVQKFKSKFRITVNGGQCISCGNCSTYCEMGIDVKWYAQRGQDIVRASCVGCGICSAVCPRGVLRLENADLDIHTRTQDLRNIHISKEGISIVE